MLTRLLSPLRLLAAAAVVLLVAAVVLITHGSNHYLEIPDQAHPLAGLVKVSGSSGRKDDGGIFYVDVLLKQASLLESLVPPLRPDGADIVNKSDIVEPGISEQQRFKLERADMKLSQLKASAVALRALGYRVPVQDGGLRVVAVTSDSHAIGLLQPGDVIVSADGKRVQDRIDLSAVLTSHRVGDVVRIGIRRGTKTRVLAIRTTSDVSDPQRPIIGVLPIQALKVHFPFHISFDLGDVGGPSAGLAFALELLEKRGRDIDHGLKVAATGEIQLDGSVTRIGGVKQKTIGARQAHVDVFLVPVDGDNAREAKRYAHGLRIIPVESFQQALQALATLRRKA